VHSDVSFEDTFDRVDASDVFLRLLADGPDWAGAITAGGIDVALRACGS